jgi:transposase
MSNINVLAIDLAKNVFQLHGTDDKGNAVLKKRLTRDKLVEFIANLNACTIVMEACGGANNWARKFQTLGHEAKLISPQFVKPFVKTNKNDRNDAEAICEAASRLTMRFVTPKTIEQQDVQSLHRIRSRHVQERTAIANQMRGLLLEFGIAIPKGITKIRSLITGIIEDANNELSVRARRYIHDLYEELLLKDKNIENYDHELKIILKESKACQRIEKIEGVGVMTATAIVACIGENAEGFESGRHLAAFFGLVPKQNSSGNKDKLLGISKRGDTHIRCLLIHGARAAIIASAKKEDKRSKWIQDLKERRGANRAAVALANKNARIIWALLSKETEYNKAS